MTLYKLVRDFVQYMRTPQPPNLIDNTNVQNQ